MARVGPQRHRKQIETNSLYKRSLNNVIEHDINRETLQAIYLMRVFQCPTTRKANVLNGE